MLISLLRQARDRLCAGEGGCAAVPVNLPVEILPQPSMLPTPGGPLLLCLQHLTAQPVGHYKQSPLTGSKTLKTV